MEHEKAHEELARALRQLLVHLPRALVELDERPLLDEGGEEHRAGADEVENRGGRCKDEDDRRVLEHHRKSVGKAELDRGVARVCRRLREVAAAPEAAQQRPHNRVALDAYIDDEHVRHGQHDHLRDEPRVCVPLICLARDRVDEHSDEIRQRLDDLNHETAGARLRPHIDSVVSVVNLGHASIEDPSCKADHALLQLHGTLALEKVFDELERAVAAERVHHEEHDHIVDDVDQAGHREQAHVVEGVGAWLLNLRDEQAEHLPKHEVDDEDGRREDQRDDDHRVRVAMKVFRKDHHDVVERVVKKLVEV
mmetsp:Transcript_54434/g.118686  ORF Transcript_54434/g.118686 Transcript_54434/m.118686 type:complete len:309 (-) Transcript_54434:265-1191(-)